MKKILTALAVVAMLVSGGAFAGQDDSDPCTDSSSNCGKGGKGGNGGNGGNGGKGGKGGSAAQGQGQGQAQGQGQLQGQLQGQKAYGGNARQGQGQIGINRNDNDLSNRNRNRNSNGQQQGQVGINKSHNDNTNVGIQGQVGINRNGSVRGTQHSSIDGNNSAARNDGNNTAVDASDNSTNSVYYEGDEAQKRNPVSTAYAAPLVASDDTCMGSTSAGGQGITLGFSFASTWRDKDCVIRKDARFLHNSQHQTVALGLMCDKDRVRKAVAIAGSPAERLACGLNEDGSEPSGKAAAAPVTTTGSATVVPASTFDWGDED